MPNECWLPRAALWTALAMGGVVGRSPAAPADATGAPPRMSREETTTLRRVHDPSTIVRCGDEYWFFYTGVGVRSYRSRDRVNWAPGPPVFREFPAWTREVVTNHTGHFWAPDVIRVNDRYLVYYSVSSWGKNRSAIGLATNATLDPSDPAFGWKDEGIAVSSTPADNFNAIDPSVLLDRDGRLWMAFGSFWSGIKLVELDPATGKRKFPDAPVEGLAFREAIEAPCLHRRGDQYYLFVNWGLCCRGTNSTYEIRVGRSGAVTGPYVDRDGIPLLHEAATPVLGTTNRFIGPGHAGILQVGAEDWMSYHYYDGAAHGRPTFALRRLRWTADGWPEVVDPAEAAAPSPPPK